VTNDRRNEYREFDPDLITNFLGHRKIVNSERIASGKSNTNFALDLSDGQRVVVRLYSENAQSSPAREKQIAEMIGDTIPIPTMLKKLNRLEPSYGGKGIWGGSDIIAGSPRANGSSIDPKSMEDIINGVVIR